MGETRGARILHIEDAAASVRQNRLSHTIAAKLRGMIASGKIKRGDRLPAEVDLLQHFRVSRPTLREALRVLEAESLVVTHRGTRGTVVTTPTVEKVSDYVSLMLSMQDVTMTDVHGARTMYEPTMIARLSEQSDQRWLDRLRPCLDNIQHALDRRDHDSVLRGLDEFHMILAHSCGNKTIALITELLIQVSQSGYRGLWLESIERDAMFKDMAKTLESYRKLWSLIDSGDYQKASEYWRDYMSRSLIYLSKSKAGKLRIELRNS